MAFTGEDILQIEWLMGTLDDLGLGVELANFVAELPGAEFAGFGDENVIGAFEIGDRLAQRATGEKIMVTEGIVAIDQANIEPAFEGEVLKAVVQKQCIATKLGYGVAAAFDTILVNKHHHVLKIGGEHVRLITGLSTVEQQGPPIRHNFRWDAVLAERDLGEQALPERAWRALVTA